MKLILIPTFLALIDFIAAECLEKLSITEQAILDYHNELRRLHQDTPEICYGVSDSTHNFFPQEWSEYLLPRGPKNVGHSGHGGQSPIGENIAWNPKVLDPVEDYLSSINKWYDEILQYSFKDKGKRNKRKNIGHVTQLIWKDTKELRCGRAPGTGEEGVFIVCQYWPKGNVGRMLPSEVKPLKDEHEMQYHGISRKIKGRILENSKKLSQSNTMEQENGEKMTENSEGPEESGYSDGELIGIIIIATLPCLLIFGIVIGWKIIKSDEVSYTPLLVKEAGEL